MNNNWSDIVKQTAAAKQAADAQFAAVINHPATQAAIAFEKQALSRQVTDALIGGGIGAALGGGAGALLSDDETRLRNALIGAALGGTAGGVGGYFGGDTVRSLLGLNTTQSPANPVDPASITPKVDPIPFDDGSAFSYLSRPYNPLPVPSNFLRTAYENLNAPLVDNSFAQGLNIDQNFSYAPEALSREIFSPGGLGDSVKKFDEASRAAAASALRDITLNAIRDEKKQRLAQEVAQILSPFTEDKINPVSIPGIIQGIGGGAGNVVGGAINSVGGFFNNTGRSIGEGIYDAGSAIGSAADAAWRGTATFLTGHDPANNPSQFEGMAGLQKIYEIANASGGLKPNEAAAFAKELQPFVVSGRVPASRIKDFVDSISKASPEERQSIISTLNSLYQFSKENEK